MPLVVNVNTKSLIRPLLFLTWVLSLILYATCPDQFNEKHISLSLVNTLIGTISFFIYQNISFKKNIFLTISFLFTLSIIISHFQIPTIHVLGYKVENSFFQYFIWGNIEKGSLSVALSSIGILSFYLGHLVTSNFNRNYVFRNNSFLRLTILIKYLTPISIVFYILFFITSGSYRLGNYGTGDQLVISNYFINFFNLFLKSALIIKMYLIKSNVHVFRGLRHYISFIGAPLTLIVFWHIIFSIYVGDRGPVIIYGLLYFGVYLMKMSKKSSAILLVSLILIPPFFSFLGAARSRYNQISILEKVNSSNYKDRYSSNFSNDTPGLSTLELALSVRCVNHAITNVPKNYDFRYGVYQLKLLAASVPFFVGFLETNILDESKELESSSDFISYLIQGRNVKYGDATTPVADLYLDFGVFGVFIGFFLFGVYTKKADSVLVLGGQTSLFFWFSIMIYWSGAIYLGRASFLYYLQTIVQMFLIVIFINSILNIKSGYNK